MKSIIVTGGAGFIGCNLVRLLLSQKTIRVINLDKLTYAGNIESLTSVMKNSNHIFIQGSIGNRTLVKKLLTEYQPNAVINLAAETHVDRSIDNPAGFIQTNITDTFELLEAVRFYWRGLVGNNRENFRFLQVSTDEVYGSLGPDGLFNENSPYTPNSPYSASKAASDHLVRAYHITYGLPVLTTICSNNYGPYQFPEKLIPFMILNALDGKELPVYGDGLNVRDWLYVKDHCRAIWAVLENGRPGEVYNIGGNNETSNIQVVYDLCDLLDEMSPRRDGSNYHQQIVYVQDRPGHDRRYSVDSSKIRTKLGWEPEMSFKTGLHKTVKWYLENREWCRQVLDGSYRGERLGLGN